MCKNNRFKSDSSVVIKCSSVHFYSPSLTKSRKGDYSCHFAKRDPQVQIYLTSSNQPARNFTHWKYSATLKAAFKLMANLKQYVLSLLCYDHMKRGTWCVILLMSVQETVFKDQVGAVWNSVKKIIANLSFSFSASNQIGNPQTGLVFNKMKDCKNWKRYKMFFHLTWVVFTQHPTSKLQSFWIQFNFGIITCSIHRGNFKLLGTKQEPWMKT